MIVFGLPSAKYPTIHTSHCLNVFMFNVLRLYFELCHYMVANKVFFLILNTSNTSKHVSNVEGAVFLSQKSN